MTSLFLNHTSCVAKETCLSHSASSQRQQCLPHLLQGEYKSCEAQMINMPTKLMWHTDSSVSQVTEDNIRKRHLTNQKHSQLSFCDVTKVYFQILVLIYVSIFYQIYTFFNDRLGTEEILLTVTVIFNRCTYKSCRFISSY